MSCDVAALTFQAHANYGTWLIVYATGFILVYIIETKNLWHGDTLGGITELFRPGFNKTWVY